VKFCTHPSIAVACSWLLIQGDAVGAVESADSMLKVVGADVVDFGRYQAHEKKIARFTLRNTGKKTVKILKLFKTCGCATAACDKTSLDKGEEANLEIVILPDSIFGTYSKPTYIESTDSRNRFLAVTVKGTAVPIAEIKPRNFIYAGRIATNAEWVHTFDILPAEAGVKLGEPAVQCDHPCETGLNSAEDREKAAYRLNFKLLPSAVSGDFQCSIQIPIVSPTNYPPLVIGISGKIGAELIAFPGTFRMPVSTNDIIKNFNLRVLGNSSVVLDPSKVSLPVTNGVQCEVRQAADGRTIAVTTRFGSEFTKELFAQEKIYLPFSVPGIASARILCLTEKSGR